jgi:hypothetical protein
MAQVTVDDGWLKNTLNLHRLVPCLAFRLTSFMKELNLGCRMP